MLVLHAAWSQGSLHVWAESAAQARSSLEDLLGQRGRNLTAEPDQDELHHGEQVPSEPEAAIIQQVVDETPTPARERATGEPAEVAEHLFMVERTGLEASILGTGALEDRMVQGPG
ncbi:MAG: hypothetical protein VXX86_00140, partial [Planctomycetota bacterium]|nr:hypothetical protein [Planctomycetota bacterium]